MSRGALEQDVLLIVPFPVFIKPYTFSVLPSGAVPIDETKNASGSVLPSFIPTSVIQIRSTLSSLPVQTLPYPFKSPSTSATTLPAGSAPVSNATIRLLTASPSDKCPLFLITTPTDRTQAAAEGSSIWQFRMKPWAQQIDELVRNGFYADALALLDTLDQVVFPDKVSGFHTHDGGSVPKPVFLRKSKIFVSEP